MRERSECATVQQSKRELYTTRRVCVCVCVCVCVSVCCVTEHARETSYCDPRSSNDRDCECERVCEVRREREEREAQARRRKRRRERPFIRLFMETDLSVRKPLNRLRIFISFICTTPIPTHNIDASHSLSFFPLSFFEYSFFFIISFCL